MLPRGRRTVPPVKRGLLTVNEQCKGNNARLFEKQGGFRASYEAASGCFIRNHTRGRRPAGGHIGPQYLCFHPGCEGRIHSRDFRCGGQEEQGGVVACLRIRLPFTAIRERIARIDTRYDPALAQQRYLTTPGHYAYLKISEGCDRKCAYCAIPGIRGRHVSVPMDELVEEARLLAAKGVCELIVIAQDTTYYGLDLYGKRMIALLLHRLSEIPGIRWIRLHYSYPNAFPDDLLDEMASNPKICKYLDIPLQHCSTKVLGKMRRNITGKETSDLIRKIRERVPGIVLRTTLIVGHPGEGKREFAELLDFVREMRFERMGAFAYSEEEGTYGAENYKDSVSRKEKLRRLDELMSLQRGISASCNATRVGTRTTVVADAVADGYYVCRSMNESPEVDGEIYVEIPEDEKEGVVSGRIGKFFEVEILRAGDYDLYGKII